MLIIAKKLKELSFGKLMEVYIEGNLENGRESWPDEPESRQIALAEQDFYNYLQQVFFKVENARYYVWEENGHYISALRLEPYRDGMLLEALETLPSMRRKGYAEKLIVNVLELLEKPKIYSHVHKGNAPSLGIHGKCGFVKISDCAVYVDGSVNDRCYTLCYEK